MNLHCKAKCIAFSYISHVSRASSRPPPRVTGSCSEAKCYQYPVPVAVRLSGAVKSAIYGIVVSDISDMKCASDVFDVSTVNVVIVESVVVTCHWREWRDSVHCLYTHSAWIILTSIDLFVHQKATSMEDKVVAYYDYTNTMVWEWDVHIFGHTLGEKTRLTNRGLMECDVIASRSDSYIYLATYR